MVKGNTVVMNRRPPRAGRHRRIRLSMPPAQTMRKRRAFSGMVVIGFCENFRVFRRFRGFLLLIL
jgi:hypothetical protein